MRIAGDSALFAFPEADLGIIPGLGGTQRLPSIITRGRAMEMILSGAIISAEEAKRNHLIDHIVPKKEVHDFSLAMMNKMTQNRDKKIIEAVMISLRNSTTMTEEEAMEEETRLFCELALDLNNERN